MELKQLVFNPLQENTYVLWDATGECIIIDPGCFHRAERQELEAFITTHHLRPVRLVLTHAHFDHVFGCRWVAERWQLRPELHPNEVPVLRMAVAVARVYGFPMDEPPEAVTPLEAGQPLRFGQTELEVRFTPGHSPGGLSFYHASSAQVVVGDVLFRGSIGRTDLPGGSMDVLAQSIRQQLYTLPDATTVWSGHGPETTIAHEKAYNPFVPA